MKKVAGTKMHWRRETSIFMNNGEKKFYTDEELEQFKSLINKKLEEAESEYNKIVEQLRNFNNNGTDDTLNSMKIMEDGSDMNIKEELSLNAARLKKFVDNLHAALFRIENKTYGICKTTGKLIPKERLMAVPHTTQSIEAKQARQ
jgi:DnaK suppressor protein